MKTLTKKIALISFSIAVAASATASIGPGPTCPSNTCYQHTYLDCLNQGLPQNLCYRAYLTCLEAQCNPV